MPARNFPDWLEAFVRYASIGEAPLPILYWVGVSTIAGALRRKVWIDQVIFQWHPNFYIITVAEPGIIAKSTTANVGFNLLGNVHGINFGPDITSWQALVKELGEIGETFEYLGGNYPMHAMTLPIDELGTFLNPEDREQIDTMVKLWDGKIGERPMRKITKTQGSDTIDGPWLNMFACTTPTWMNSNFPEYFLGSGWFSRCICLHAKEKRQRVSFPGRNLPADYHIQKARLIADLQQIAETVGPFDITEAAYAWGDKHYNDHWDKYTVGSRELMGYPARKQTHLFKLAMVISVSRGHFPRIDVEHVIEAERQLSFVEPGINNVFNIIGAKGIPKASVDIVDAVVEMGGCVWKREVFGKHFFRRLSNREFDEALRGAIGAGKLVVDVTPKGLLIAVPGKLPPKEGVLK